MITEELFKRFLNDRCSGNELESIFDWIRNDALKSSGRQLGFKDWTQYNNDESDYADVNFESMLDKIHHEINLSNKNVVIRKRFRVWYGRVACILLIGLFLYSVFLRNWDHAEKRFSYLGNDTIEIISPVGSQSVIHLSDGSVVHLNQGSRLKYTTGFPCNREVLLEGEGFFKIAHDPSNPFVVKTAMLDITALGTTFNVIAYADDDFVETTLVEGEVIVANYVEDAAQKMKPGESLVYNSTTNDIITSYGIVDDKIAWTEGKLVFKNESLDIIIKKLSRWYNVDIIVEDDQLLKETYTATFVDETLTQVLDLMKLATPINYYIQGRTVNEDGSFSKQTIVINSR